MPTNPTDLFTILNTGGIVALLAIVFWLFLKGEMVPRDVSQQLIEANRAAAATADAATRAITAFGEDQKRVFAELTNAYRQIGSSLDRLLEQDQRIQTLTERLARLEEKGVR